MDDADTPRHLVVKSDGDSETELDVSEEILELPLVKRSKDSVNAVYIYKNSFDLIPRAIGGFSGLRTLKFFANEINVFPLEVGDLAELECLQVKVSSPGISEIPFLKLKSLKELELRKLPPRLSELSLLTGIASLKLLTKLSLCHFSIRYLPPEIGCLKKLEDLDLSFNKLKSLPDEIALLSVLRSLRLANNKLMDLPSALSCLKMLETLDLSHNRLTSLGSLKLTSMHALSNLNLQYNKLVNCQIPSWISCNLEGNGKDTECSEEIMSSLIEVDAVDVTIPDADQSSSHEGGHGMPSRTISSDASSINSRCSVTRSLKKGWRRRDFLQRKARQECLNNSRKSEAESIHDKAARKHCERSKVRKEDVDTDKNPGETDTKVVLNHVRDNLDNRSGSVVLNEDFDYKCTEEGCQTCLTPLDKTVEREVAVSLEASSNNLKPKRHSDRALDNPKPSKCQRPIDECYYLSSKYSEESVCGFNDHLPDGFYDAGRDCPFMPLQNYEEHLSFESREVILVDRERDEELDVLALSAHVLVSSLKRSRSAYEERKESLIDDLQRASVLALFVSDFFGGSDRADAVARMRRAVAGSNVQKPFICTCSNSDSNFECEASSDQIFDLCNKSLRFIKEARNSNIVPIGTLRFGVCRHRALLMKYLCDRADPPIPCELVRGYLDYQPHAWNSILLKKGDSWVRMIVDACHPTDIREETDPEYFCRYIPFTRVHDNVVGEQCETSQCAFPTISVGEDADKSTSRCVIKSKFGERMAAAKVRTFKAPGASVEKKMEFEYSCLGEIRMLGALRNHSCIVDMYGHQFSSKWASLEKGTKVDRLMQFTLMMEYVGGSLKDYLEKLYEVGEKHVPVKLALSIARDVANALVELHSKLIIHRDIKSENILIDLDMKRTDGTPVVKLCDFDMAVPLESTLHTCCIRHYGVYPPDVCVGTPNWMAPEVLQAMHTRSTYGMEVDIWSFGCLLFELVTLQMPYASFPPAKVNHLLETKQRPPLPAEFDILLVPDDPTMTRSVSLNGVSETDTEGLKILVDLFYHCTKPNPADRPTAMHVYDKLRTAVSSLPDLENESCSSISD
ncbi:hypothetical protein H6P81_004670 [Aristolochia fimbriata]|uniref:Protein kinase domain-containing protein n=1 Tax=Aristolochia fimbriata TaxID=158543 RepID=A0AAV7EVA3_ARIFI|nr:hypothetical protein H6P81_004670 [Aristolochia fimbriata]